MYLWWHGNFYSSGEYIALEENRSVTFKWFGRFDPAPSEVKVTLEPKEDGCLVTMAHTVPDGPGWMRRADDFAKEWSSTLGNLAQVLETGIDQRTSDRPLLGIEAADFNPEIASSLGVPVTEGLRIAGVSSGLGAEKAGLRKDDVIIELGGSPIKNDLGTFILALQGKKAGEQVEVTFYRGSQKQTVTMELSRRPIPQVSATAEELAEQVREKYATGLSALGKALANVSEAKAAKRARPDAWSARDVLAHLILTERHLLEDLDDLIAGYPRLSDEWGGNSDLHVRAVVATYKTTGDMLNELTRLADELEHYLRELPEVFLARRAAYLRVATVFLDGALPHMLSHVEQIKKALKLAQE
jgi:hypothetical protein